MTVFTFLVKKAEEGDVGRAIARFHPEDMSKLEVSVGDILKIEGSRVTAVRALPAHPDSRELGSIQIDGIVRKNTGAALDEDVQVKKIECPSAQKITLEPLGETLLSRKESNVVQGHLESMPVCVGDKVRITPFGNKFQEFTVTDLIPKEPCLVAGDTIIELAIKEQTDVYGEVDGFTYEDVGGLKQELERVREMIELPLRHPELFERLGIEPPKGILLYGPPGCGKTLIASAIANEVDAEFISISGSEFFVKWVGESAKRVREKFAEARSSAPAILFIDEFDALAPKRESLDVGGAAAEQHKNVVTQLCASMDGLKERGEVIVIGATNLPDSIDPALRRPGRFDREIEIGVPDRDGRLEILKIHSRAMPLAEDVDLQRIAEQTHGFVGADIAAVCREAAMSVLRRILPDIDLRHAFIPPEAVGRLYVESEDFKQALKEVQPSALREVYLEKPSERWENVGGLDNVKDKLVEAVEWPLRYPDLFEHTNTNPPRGILLQGPPGCGKTLIAKALANESEVNFISVKGSSLISKWVGDTEKRIHEIFRKAKQHAPCIIFFDEIDALVPQRGQDSTGVSDRALGQLRAEIDGMDALTGVLVLAATNRPDLLDESLIRSGRFDGQIEIPVPDEHSRRKIFEIHTRKKPLAEDVNIGELVQLTDGCTGADIANICMRASLLAIREFIESGSEDKAACLITKEHFNTAITDLLAVDEADVLSA